MSDQELSALKILKTAAKHIGDRAVTYDKPKGERSIPPTVAAFNAITGHTLTEEQGWLFMTLLKAVRAQQGEFKLDNYEDLASYAALMGEQAFSDRNPPSKKEVKPQSKERYKPYLHQCRGD